MPFSQTTTGFLVENRLNDSKEWFHAHKEEYNRHVLAPFVELVELLSPAMLEIDPQLITQPRVDRTISRIYRDTRFSKDKMLYRDNMWIVFMREKKLYDGLPAFYFDLSPTGFSYGMGYYQASRESLDAIRELILRNEPSFQAAVAAYEAQSIFTLEGDAYKRTRYPDAAENVRLWLDKKGFSFNCHCARLEEAYSDKLHERLTEGFMLLVPIYRFLCAAEARRLPK